MRIPVLLTLACTGFLAASAQAQLVVGNDQSGTATIYQIDVGTGVATPIYSATTNEAKPWGMAFDNTTNTLYWNNGAVLYSSPLANPLVPTNLGNMMLGAATVNFVALSFANGKLYGTRNITTEAVYEIDPSTLIATQVYVYPAAFDFGGLEHDTATGLLYGLTDAAPAPDVRGLYRIDLLGMTQTFVAPYPAGETDIDGLAVHNGIAYYVTDGPNTTQANFYVFDVATGLQTGTIPSPFTGSGTFCAATWIEGSSSPTTPFCLGDGSGSPCPCGNNGAPGSGCASSGFASGALLNAAGTASIAADTLVLTCSSMTGPGLFFQGNGLVANPIAFGDGMLCAAVGIIRMGVVFPTANSAAYPGGTTPNPIHIAGAPINPGDVKHYQCWYRDAATFCTADTFNLSNGVSLTWAP